MRVSVIVAMTPNRVIGRDGGLPWRIAEDLKRFKAITLGKPVIMGRKTYESIGEPLPGRANIVVTRDPAYASNGVEVASDFDDALRRAEAAGSDEAMVIGGAEIYRLALPQAERLYVTEVEADVDGDTYFPDFDRGDWREVSREAHDAGGTGAPAYSFVVLKRR